LIWRINTFENEGKSKKLYALRVIVKGDFQFGDWFSIFMFEQIYDIFLEKEVIRIFLN